MSVLATDVDAQDSRVRHVAGRPTFLGIVRSEWIKLLSLRSTWWVLTATVVLITGISLAVAYSLKAMIPGPSTLPGGAEVNSAELIAGGSQLGMVTIAVLGVLAITGEYSTGMISSTLVAVPTRVPVLAAKAMVLTALTVVVGTIGIALSYLVTMPVLADYHLVAPLDQFRTWQVYAGTVYFLVAAGLFALGTGTLLRSSAGAITVTITVLLVLPGLLSFINLDWVRTMVGYLPVPASAAFLGANPNSPASQSAEVSAVMGIVVVAAYAVIPLLAGTAILRHRDT